VRLILLPTLLAALTMALGCGQQLIRYDRTTVLAGVQDDKVGLILGAFPLSKVLDGDTIRVDGLNASLRLLGLDSEETFKYRADYMAYEKGWAVYLAEAQARTKSPVKIATPLGDEAKKFAQKFFDGVRIVHLERDHPKEIRDFYNRYLTYVFVEKDGKRLNYNVECVRAGMSPYFSKYGYSRRFHHEFVAAQAEARKAQRGIWDPAKQHYPDYDRRLEWWDRRADYIQAFERDAKEHKNYVVLTHWDAFARLEDLLGREVVVLGSVGDIRKGATGPTRVMLSRRRTASFPLIFFDEDVLSRSGVEAAKGEFIRAHGIVAKYRNKYTNKDALQIVVTMPEQVEREAPPAPEPVSTEPTEPTPAEPPPAEPPPAEPPQATSPPAPAITADPAAPPLPSPTPLPPPSPAKRG
jgi:endonuclease YncB( thermonuclease family)